MTFDYLKSLKVQELEDRDRLGYQKYPADPTEAADWEQVALWPERTKEICASRILPRAAITKTED